MKLFYSSYNCIILHEFFIFSKLVSFSTIIDSTLNVGYIYYTNSFLLYVLTFWMTGKNWRGKSFALNLKWK